jgi:hypothetical protein
VPSSSARFSLRPAREGLLEADEIEVHISRRRLALALVPAAVVAAAACAAALAPGALAALTADHGQDRSDRLRHGYTILPVLQQDVVNTHHWLSRSTFGAGTK